MNEQIPWWAWALFGALLLVLLALDLYVHRGEHADNRTRAIVWSAIWIGAGLAFGGFVWVVIGATAGHEYLAAWLIEKSLSLDNLFVFLVIFQSLNIPKRYQHNVLFWGIFGALVFRAVFIFVGARALERYDWVSYVFAGLLVFAAVRIFLEDPAEQEENRAVKWLSKHLPVTHEIHGHAFIAHEDGRRVVTPLLIALMGLELSDILFAVDSVPAAFSVTRNEFLIYSSNAFAILGLRSLYLVLAHSLDQLRYLHYGLSLVLAFAGAKIVLEQFDVHIPALLSVGVIAAIIGVAIFYSLRHNRRERPGGAQPEAAGD